MLKLNTFSRIFIPVIFLISLFTLSQTAAARPEMGSEKGPGKGPGPEHLIKELNITDAQKDEFLSIMKSQHEKRMQVHEAYRSSHEEEKEAMDSLHQETVEKLQTVLTESQLQQFETFVKSHRPPRPIGDRNLSKDDE